MTPLTFKQWELSSNRIEVKLHFLIYDPTIARNPQGTPITASFFGHIKAAMR
jgi:hypothetical protein